jgi:hypothetical protein
MTFIETPAWCIAATDKAKKGDPDYHDWDETTCDDRIDPIYTKNVLFFLPPDVSLWLELATLTILFFFQVVRNKFRDQDRSSERSWKVQRLLTAISMIDIIVVLCTPNNYGFP